MAEDWIALKQQVKDASDIVAVVGGYITLQPVGPTFKGLCPFHDDQRPSFDVDPRRQRYRCWACGKHGDVFDFVQEFERVGFPEALELLARRAGISLESLKKSPQGPSRARMLDVVRWAEEQFRSCLLDDAVAEAARVYLGSRRLLGDTVRRFGLGFAPAAGEWLVARAARAKLPTDLLEQVGLIARRNDGNGWYDRFRDRVMFPIRDLRGQTVGFGGRILPSSPMAERAPKYYNSAEGPLFSKSEILYGLDLARQTASKLGSLAVVEGYTDVMMAHQFGIEQVVATMGTALTQRHVRKLRGLVRQVVLVYDADAGGEGGVDRALEIFVAHDLDLRVATLPQGLDPCDLLTRDGADAFRAVLEGAVDVLEFKLRRVWAQEASQGLEGQRRAVDRMLTTLAAAPEERTVKTELMINRIAHRLQVREETLWGRLREMRAAKKSPARREDVRETEGGPDAGEGEVVRTAPAARHEVELAELLLGHPHLVAAAREQLPVEDVEHPGLRRLVQALYALHDAERPADLDHLRDLVDNEKLMEKARDLQARGLDHAEPDQALAAVLERCGERRLRRRNEELKQQVRAADDHARAVALLAQLTNRSSK